MPAYVDTGLNLVDVRDVAAGHRLALERGRPGRRYILGNENLTLREILRDAGRRSPAGGRRGCACPTPRPSRSPRWTSWSRAACWAASRWRRSTARCMARKRMFCRRLARRARAGAAAVAGARRRWPTRSTGTTRPASRAARVSAARGLSAVTPRRPASGRREALARGARRTCAALPGRARAGGGASSSPTRRSSPSTSSCSPARASRARTTCAGLANELRATPARGRRLADLVRRPAGPLDHGRGLLRAAPLRRAGRRPGHGRARGSWCTRLGGAERDALLHQALARRDGALPVGGAAGAAPRDDPAAAARAALALPLRLLGARAPSWR